MSPKVSLVKYNLLYYILEAIHVIEPIRSVVLETEVLPN